MKPTERKLRLLICLLLCLCITATLGFWIHECSHDCGGEDCIICQDALLLQRKMLTGDLWLLLNALMLSIFPVLTVNKGQNLFPPGDTPVLRKVKLTI